MIMHLRRIFLLSAVAVAIIMQGCGCNGSKKHYPSNSQEPAVTVEGKASKGILQGFSVTAYPLGLGPDGISIAQSITDNDGEYRLQIPRSQSHGDPKGYLTITNQDGVSMSVREVQLVDL